MKKIFKKLIVIILCISLLGGIAIYAYGRNSAADTSPAPNGFADFAEKFSSVFAGSANEKADVKFTITQGEIFEAKKYFSDSHASTIAKMPDGNLISAFFAGPQEGNADVRIWYSIHDGEGWSEPKQLASPDPVAHWNPVLINYGDYMRLYYKVGMEIPNWVTKYCDSFDCGKTWTEPQELVPGDTSGGRGPVKNKLIVTSKGTIIAPASSEQGSWRAFFDISEDGGKTWTKTDFVIAKDSKGNEVGMIQPTLWEDKEGNIHAMFRTKAGRIYRTDSTDGGYTWCEAYSTDLMNNNSGIDCVMTDNGWLWLAYTPVGMEVRNRLILSVSKDNGKTWQDVTVLEESANLFAEYSYPAIIAEGNNLYITYTYNRVTIKYAFIEFEG
ncbi:MAG: exo-alpha-sialidase [Clostridia bacterium]|nr:exo-alpha-sialidase [Clostridia bacterium]